MKFKIEVGNMKLYEDLQARDFIYQSTDEVKLKEMINEKQVAFYAGFDPTGDSLHVGHLLPVMGMRRFQQAGHTPIVLVGGATALVGDPSGKQDARPILTKEKVSQNADALKKQLGRFIDFENGKAIFVNNADWFLEMNFLDFLREVGSRFSVNRMLAAESVKQRLETGLSYLEFSYMLLQGYDFYHLNQKFDCLLQIGGQDQWGNMLAGTDLVRKLAQQEASVLTFPLLTDSTGAKFGKTAGGAVWLDTARTSIFDYYQFWRNSADAEVGKLLKLFTNLPVDEINELATLQPPLINRAKEILAYEATALAHGVDEAEKVYLTAGSKFGFADKDGVVNTSSNIKKIKQTVVISNDLPVVEFEKKEFEGDGKWIVQTISDAGLASSNGEARRLIKGGGCYLNDKRISDMNYSLNLDDFENQTAVLRTGKKRMKLLKLK
jgi:tyrosyl-tRNA synthetase